MESNKENLNVDHESETMIYLQRFLFCLLVVSEKVLALFQSCGFYVARTRGDLGRTYFSISFNYCYYYFYFFYYYFLIYAIWRNVCIPPLLQQSLKAQSIVHVIVTKLMTFLDILRNKDKQLKITHDKNNVFKRNRASHTHTDRAEVLASYQAPETPAQPQSKEDFRS